MKENLIDKLAKEALTDYKIPFKPAHWKLMEAKLKQHKAQHQQSVYFIKGVEFLLMSATVWTLFYYANGAFSSQLSPATEPALLPNIPIKNLNTTIDKTTNVANKNGIINGSKDKIAPKKHGYAAPIAAISAEEAAVEYKSTTTKNTTIAPTNNIKSSVKNSVSLTTISSNAAIKNDGKNKVETEAKTMLPLPSIAPKPKAAGTPSNAAEQLIIAPAAPVIHEAPPLPPASPPSAANTDGAQNNDVNANLNSNSTDNSNNNLQNQYNIEKIPTLIPSLLEQFIDTKLPINTAMPVAVLGSEQPYDAGKARFRRWGLQLNLSPDYILVKQVGRDFEARQLAVGRSLGLGVVYRANHTLSFRSGVRLSQKDYTTSSDFVQRPIAIASTREAVLRSQLLFSEIPLEIVGNIFQNNDFQIYATAGTSWYYVLNGAYQWRDGSKTTYTATNTVAAMQDLSLAKAEQSGNFALNNYWSANIGAGFAYRFGKRGSIFVEPTYRYGFKGLGLRNDKINTCSLVFGGTYYL